MRKTIIQDELDYYSDFYNLVECKFYFDSLYKQIQWQQYEIKLFGKSHLTPRLSSFYGDVGVKYRYSGITLKSINWNNSLLKIKENIEKTTGAKYNSVLLNLYRNGRDYMGLHSDDELELGKTPIIASVSFGEERKFVLKSKDKKNKIELNLENGSLLLMKGKCQSNWKHELPKQLKKKSQRINLTFRYIVNSY